MKNISLLAVMALLGGCRAMPDLADTSNAELRFRVHYQAPGLTSPYVEYWTNISSMAGRCVYVNEPFAVSANAADKGGIRSIAVGPSQSFGNVALRDGPGDIIAFPGPAEPTQGSPAFPNPGHQPGSAAAQVVFSTARAYDSVSLLATYRFANGANRAAFRGTARNFGATTGVSEVYHFFVEKATSDPGKQPGMTCAVGVFG